MLTNAYRPLRGLLLIILGVTALTVFSKTLGAKDQIPWRTDLPAAVAEAKEAGKPVLLYFTATWCGPCQQMRRATWSNAAVDGRLRSSFVPVKVDIDANRPAAISYAIDAVPTIVLLDGDGKVAQQTSGFMAADELLAWLDASAGI